MPIEWAIILVVAVSDAILLAETSFRLEVSPELRILGMWVLLAVIIALCRGLRSFPRITHRLAHLARTLLTLALFTNVAAILSYRYSAKAECLRSLRKGDTPIVWRLNRLGRSVKDLVALINELRERGVEFVSLTEAIDTTTPMGSFIFHITAALAELERSIIRERTRAGLASARARGRKGGRPKKLNDRELRAIRTLVDARELTVAEIAAQYGVSPATIYRRRARA
jgi:hypothetical protein